MKNERPIVLNCFSRGGSNILWNILLSHPECCSPMQETLEIFRLDWRDIRKEGLYVAWLTRQWNFFNQWNLHPRKPVSARAQSFMDETLFRWKLKTLVDSEMRFKSGVELYTHSEVENARLVLKNNNGTIFLSEQFAEMYPGIVFFGLVRDPIPLYESHKRNRSPVGTSPEKFATFYKHMVQKMCMDTERWDFYHLLRFEDILSEPLKAIRKIYGLAGLDIDKAPQMRFKAKPHMQADGSHSTPFRSGKHYWFPYDEIPQMLQPEVNRHQVSKLDLKELDQIRFLTGDVRSQLGYAEG